MNKSFLLELEKLIEVIRICQDAVSQEYDLGELCLQARAALDLNVFPETNGFRHRLKQFFIDEERRAQKELKNKVNLIVLD